MTPPPPRKLAEHEGRELWLLSRAAPWAWEWDAGPDGVCVIAWLDAPGGELAAFARSVLAAGAKAVLCAGARAGELEDAVLAALSGKPVPVTNHEGQRLDEILWEAFYMTPDAPILLVVFDEPRAAEAERLAADLDAAFAAVEDREP